MIFIIKFRRFVSVFHFIFAKSLSANSSGIIFSQTRLFKNDTEKKGNALFNTFYLRLYGGRHMVKDHSDSDKGNLLPPHRLLFTTNSKGSFICTIPQTG